MKRLAAPVLLLMLLVGIEVTTACFYRPPSPPPATRLPNESIAALKETGVAYVPAGGDLLRQLPEYRESPLRLKVTAAAIRRSNNSFILYGELTDSRTGAPLRDGEVRVGLGPLEDQPGSQPPTKLFRQIYPIPIAPDGVFTFEYPIDYTTRLVFITGSEPVLIYNVGQTVK